MASHNDQMSEIMHMLPSSNQAGADTGGTPSVNQSVADPNSRPLASIVAQQRIDDCDLARLLLFLVRGPSCAWVVRPACIVPVCLPIYCLPAAATVLPLSRRTSTRSCPPGLVVGPGEPVRAAGPFHRAVPLCL